MWNDAKFAIIVAKPTFSHGAPTRCAGHTIFCQILVYPSIPHQLIREALLHYCVPDDVAKLILAHLTNVKMTFSTGDFTTKWQKSREGDHGRVYHLNCSIHYDHEHDPQDR